MAVLTLRKGTCGSPCCAVHGCQVPLENNRNRFCPQHKDEAGVCGVVGCCHPVDPGFQTCSNGLHWSLKDHLKQKNKAMFQLKHRLERLCVSALTTSIPEDKTEDGAEGFAEGFALPTDFNKAIDVDVLQDKKESQSGAVGTLSSLEPVQAIAPTKCIRAVMSRVRSHNEQLVVRPCSIIVGRRTFFGAESVIQLIAFLKDLFIYPDL